MNKHLAAAMMVVLIAAGAASADLLAYEGFDGYSAGDLDGQGSPSGSEIGYAGTETWNVQEDSSVDGWKAETGGLSYGSLVVNGGNAQAWRGNGSEYNDTDGSDATLAPSSPLTSTSYTELYFSALIDGDSLSAVNSLIVAWDHETANDRLHGFEIRGAGNEINVYSLGSQGDENADTGLDLATGVNLIVVKVTEKTAGNDTDEYELWLNPDLVNPGAADYTAPASFNDGLVVNNDNFGFDGFYLNEALNNSSSGSDGAAQSAQVDELRLGETFADVTPIPEPATMSLLALGGLGALLRRRR